MFSDAYPEDWGKYSKAFFSLFQLLTLDNWGRGGLMMYNSEGNWRGMIIVAFNFFFNFCFLNYFIGCVVDYLNFEERILEEIEKINDGQNGVKTIFLINCVFGKYYNSIMKGFLALILANDCLFESKIINKQYNSLITLFIICCFTGHFMIFLAELVRSKRVEKRKLKKIEENFENFKIQKDFEKYDNSENHENYQNFNLSEPDINNMKKYGYYNTMLEITQNDEILKNIESPNSTAKLSKLVKKQENNENLTEMQFFLGFLSGPFALFMFFFLNSSSYLKEILNILICMKLFSINPCKFILYDNIRVISMLFTYYLFIFLTVFLVGILLCIDLSTKVPNSFGSMNRAFFTVMEIITLDNWASSILTAIKPYMSLAPFIEIMLIIIIHFLLINIVNALACNEMNLIYQNRTGLQITRYLFEVDDDNVILIKHANQEILESSLQMITTYESFVRRYVLKRNQDLMKSLDPFIILQDIEEIQNYYYLRRAVLDSRSGVQIQLKIIKDKFIHKEKRIKVLSSMQRKRTMIFELNTPVHKHMDVDDVKFSPLLKELSEKKDNNQKINSKWGPLALDHKKASMGDISSNVKQKQLVKELSMPNFRENLAFNTFQNENDDKTVSQYSNFDDFNGNGYEDLSLLSSTLKACYIVYKGKRIRLKNLHFLRLNNNVRILSKQEDVELNNKIKKRADTF